MANLSEEDQENLVAYLDGELDEEASRDLEARLGRDTLARAEADALRRTWELLDYLPRPEPSPSFTHRTLERLSIQQPITTGVGGRRRWRRWLLGMSWAAAVLLAASVGFVASKRLRSPEPAVAPARESPELEDVLVQHLRVIENKRVYDEVEDLDFLRSLENPDLFGDDDVGS
jgi:anti-sigma factor RsiW